jgi:putative ABC transport system permease protein
LETFLQDVRFGWRMLLKNPVFAIVAAITLALGIGVNTAIFSMVDWLLLRPLPVKDPAQLTVLAYQQRHGNLQNQFSVPEYRDIREQSRTVFPDVFGYQFSMDGLSVNGKADRLMTVYVTGNYFTGLGLQPAAGRLILPTEGATPGGDPVIVLGYEYWQSRFGGDIGIVGQKVSVDGHPFTIVGVAPKGFHGLYPVVEAQAYLPLGMNVITGTPRDFMQNRALRNVVVFGRLRSGVSLERAQAALSLIGHRMAQQNPLVEKDFELQVFPELRARPQPSGDNTIMIVSGLFLSLSAMVLLLACLNVANILLVRASVREREMAIRTALGAPRGRLIRQLLTESILLALAGGVTGILLGRWGSYTLSTLNVHTDLPVRFDFDFDWRVFAYAFGAALLTGLIVGILPALRVSSTQVAEVLHKSGRSVIGGGQRLRSTLVAVQVGGSLMLLIIAGLFMRSLNAAQRTDLGFDPDHVLNVAMDPIEIGYKPPEVHEFYKTLLERVHALPGIVSASTASSVPMSYYNNGDGLTIEGYQPPPGEAGPGALYSVISPVYFETMRIPLIRGRAFTDSDDEESLSVAIVNEAFVKKYWPNQEPIGRRFRMNSDPSHWLQVVGVTRNSRFSTITGDIDPIFYIPFAQHAETSTFQVLQVRTATELASMIPAVERTIQSVAPDLPFFDVKTMRQSLYTLNGLMFFQIGAGLAAVLGLLGLVLSVVGVYGVISYSATQRTQEIGIRMALGAQPRNILAMMLRQGTVIVAVGLLIGIAGALAAAKLVSNLLVISGTDPTTYVAVSAFLTLVALAACYIPARRTMRVDPTVALRYE